jgi:hypothetical protein
MPMSTANCRTKRCERRELSRSIERRDRYVQKRKKRYTGRRHRLQRVSIFAETSIASVLILAGTPPRVLGLLPKAC